MTVRHEIENILSPAIDVRAPYAKCMIDALVKLLSGNQPKEGVMPTVPDKRHGASATGASNVESSAGLASAPRCKVCGATSKPTEPAL